MKKSVYGFSFIEIMIGLFLSTLIVSMMLYHFLRINQHSKVIEAQILKAYDLETVSELLRSRIREAGYTPCAAIHHLTIKNHLSASNEILPIRLSPTHDDLSIYHMAPPLLGLQQFLSSESAIASGEAGLQPNDVIMIADCFHAEIVQLQAIHSTQQQHALTFKQALSFVYTQPTYIGRWLEERFFMKKNPQGHRRLFYQHAQHTEELAHEISDMVIEQIMPRAHRQLWHIQLWTQSPKAWLIKVAARMP